MRPPLPRFSTVLAIAVVLAAASSACGGDDDTAAAAGDEPASVDGDLAGRTFLSTAVTEDGQPRPLVDGTRVSLRFDDGTISADAGCNSIGGAVEIDGDRLVVGELEMTAMGCEQPLADQDEWLSGVLFDDPGYTLDGDTLRLTSGTTVIELTDREVADPDRPLEGTEWQLDGLADGDAVSSVPAGTGATVTFADGQVEFAIDGCNSGSGPATIASADAEADADGTIEIGDLMSTLIGCMSPAADVEAAVTGVLAGRIDYTIDAGTLTLTHPSGRGLVLRAATATSD